MGEVRTDRKIRLTGATGVALGILLGALGVFVLDHLRSSAGIGPSGSEADRVDASSIGKLQQALALQVEVHSDLADRIARLDERVSQMQLQQDYAIGMQPDRGDVSGDDSERGADAAGAGAGTGDDAEKLGFDDSALLEQGVHPSEVERLHELWESHELERAEITNRALRNGTFFKEPHSAELTRLDQRLRENLSDEDFDRYLYARGDPNRIRASQVLNGSAANRAGIRSGDTIIRYDDKRIFGPGDLLRESSVGVVGESVPVTIDRPGAGQKIVYIERGPLGILMQQKKAPPLPD